MDAVAEARAEVASVANLEVVVGAGADLLATREDTAAVAARAAVALAAEAEADEAAAVWAAAAWAAAVTALLQRCRRCRRSFARCSTCTGLL